MKCGAGETSAPPRCITFRATATERRRNLRATSPRTARFPNRFAASASLYGVGIVTDAEDSPHLLIDRIKGEMYFGFAETDEHVPANVIPTLKSALDKAGTRYGLDVFPNSRHGFQFPERDVYETHAAEESWSKVVAMWDRNLKIADVGRMTAS